MGERGAPVRFLAAVDGSEHAVRACRTAVGLLQQRGQEVLILVVLSFELDPYTLLGEDLADTPERLEIVRGAVEQATAEPRQIFEEAGYTVSVRHRFGNPADEILDEIGQWGTDLVIMGRRGLSRASRWLLGSVSDRVVRHAHVPVLIIP